MRRAILLATLFTAAVVGAFHQSTGAAQAAPTCTITHQFDDTFAQQGWFISNNGTLTAHCTSKWYVKFQAQCSATGGSGFSACVNNYQCVNQIACTPNTNGWGSGTTHTYGPSGTPTGFSDYWDNGDGFNQSGGVCDYVWRTKEIFRTGDTNVLISSAFSPESSGTCV